MKTSRLTAEFKGTELTVWLLQDDEGIMVDMSGYERQYFNTLDEATKRGKEMLETGIDNLKYN